VGGSGAVGERWQRGGRGGSGGGGNSNSKGASSTTATAAAVLFTSNAPWRFVACYCTSSSSEHT